MDFLFFLNFFIFEIVNYFIFIKKIKYNFIINNKKI